MPVHFEREASGGDAEGRAPASPPAAYEAFEHASQWRMLALALAQASRDCVKLIDLEGRVTGVNSAALKLLQIGDPAEIVGTAWEASWKEPELALVRDSIARGKSGLSTSFAGFCPTAKGEPRWWEVEVAPVPDESGVVRCLVAVSRDVTSTREHEQEMQGALKRQRQALLTRDAHLLRHIVSGEATLSVEAAPDAWAVLGAPQRFQSVAFNLVANARDAIARNGRVEVKLENCPSAARPPGLEAGDYVAFSVADNGSGMPPETLRRAGEPFFTTKAAGKGTGLGLASAFELAAACGGRAFVESEAGAGTRVSVYLRRSPVEGERVEAPAEPGLHGGAKILLVDDDPLTRDHLASVFRALHYVVVEASAYEIAAAHAEVEGGFDLVVADFDLKDGRGDAMVAELRGWRPSPPTIYLAGGTGAASPQGETVLMKPVSETRLARAVLEKLGRLPGSLASPEALRAIERIVARIQDEPMRRAIEAWRTHVEAEGRIPTLDDEGPWRETTPPLSYVVAVGAGVDPELRFERVGAELSARLGRPLVGSILGPGDEQVLGDVARGIRRRLDGAPGYRYARFALGDGKVSLVERLLLPLGDADGRVGRLFGLVAFNEANAP